MRLGDLGTISSWTIYVFLLVVAFVITTFVIGATMAGAGQGSGRVWQRWAAASALLWLIITAGVAASGILEVQVFPPPLMLYFVTVNGLMLALALSPIGRAYAAAVPFGALVGSQAFRLPLEIVLHQWWLDGVLPIQMTYQGHNFDIVTGVLALALGLFSLRWQLPKAVVLAFNLVGLGFLTTVASIAVLSSPLPIRMYMNEPAVLLAFYVPTTWIIPFAVGPALFTHVVLFRALADR